MKPLLGSVADDFTGATDLANMLARAGMRTVLVLGRPAQSDPVPEAEAVVVALKSRTAPVAAFFSRSVCSPSPSSSTALSPSDLAPLLTLFASPNNQNSNTSILTLFLDLNNFIY